MDWYPRYPSRFDSGTLGFTLAERGAYSGLLDVYYASGQPIPSDPRQIAALLRVPVDEWMAVSVRVLRKFVKKGDKLVNAVCEREIRKQQRLARLARENGKKGGRPKTSNDRPGTHPAPPDPPEVGTQKKPQTDRQGQTDRQTDRQGGANGKNGNGHHHESTDLGRYVKSSLRRASHAAGEISRDEKQERWAQKQFRFMRAHYSADDAGDAWVKWNSGDPVQREEARRSFNDAEKDFRRRQASGTLQPMDEV